MIARGVPDAQLRCLREPRREAKGKKAQPHPLYKEKVKVKFTHRGRDGKIDGDSLSEH